MNISAGEGHTPFKEAEKRIRKELAEMAEKKKSIPTPEEMTPMEKMKYEIAEELGLLDRVKRDGWKSLTAKETGRIGGLMNKRRRS